MRKTSVTMAENPLAVTLPQLKQLLGVGTVTARKIADEAGANMMFGKRRLYNVEKIREYLYKNSN